MVERASLPPIELAVLESDDELIPAMLAKFDWARLVLEVAHLDARHSLVQPIHRLDTLAVDAGALNRGSSAILRPGESKSTGLDLEEASHVVDSIHGVFVLLVQGEVQVLTA